MSHHQTDYVASLRARGFRVTPQRQTILDAVCAGGGHTTLPEIYARVQAAAPAINLATVYRTLDFLQQAGLVVTADIGGHTVYEIAGPAPHHHLVCQVCGCVEEIDPALVKVFFTTLAQAHAFDVDVHHLVLTGYCGQCRPPRRAAEEVV